MKKSFWTRLLASSMTLALAFGLAACGGSGSSSGTSSSGAGGSAPGGTGGSTSGNAAAGNGETLKVALVMPGEISDMGWNAQAYSGLEKAAKDFGVEIKYSEKVSDSDAEEYFRGFANDGFDLVIGHGFEYAQPVEKVASQFPDCKFVVTSVNVAKEPNFGSISINNPQQGFLAGVVAASISQNGKVGYIGGREIPPVIEKQKNSELGAKYANPDINYSSIILGSYDDMQKAQESALSMIESGVDVIIANADKATLAVLDICEEKGVKCVGMGGYYTGTYTVQPADVINDAAACVYQSVKELVDGTWKPEFEMIGLEADAVKVDNMQDWVSADALATIDKAKAALLNDEIELVFVS